MVMNFAGELVLF